MTQENIQLLFKDLSARLPYGVKCKVNFDDGTSDVMKLSQFPDGLGIWGFYKEGCCGRTNNFKPYLRPMRSMTDEERLYFHRNSSKVDILVDEEKIITKPFYGYTIHLFDWLNAHHFDYHNLIEKSLAIIAPDGMYKTE